MAGQGPQVVATISGVDNFTPTLDKALAHARTASETMSRMSGGIAGNLAANAHAMSGHMGVAADAISGRFRSAAVDASIALGGLAFSGARAALHVGEAMERTSRQMSSFTSATKQQLDAMRALADVQFSNLKGGPEGIFSGMRAASMSGVSPQNADIAARYGAIFAQETNTDNAEATEKLIQHTSMMGHLRDAAGKTINFAEASRDQIDDAFKVTLNTLIAINKIAPGNLNQVFEGFKFAGPAIRGFHRDPLEGAALYTGFAEAGLGGAEAGNAIRSGYSRLAAPTAKARQAIATGGLTFSDYVDIDENAMSPEDIKKGLAQRIGTLSASTSAGVDKALAAFHNSKDLNALNETLTNVLLGSGVKQMRDRVVASNLASQTTGIFTKTVDLLRFLSDVEKKGLGTGFLNQVLGKEMGSRFSAIDGAEIIRLRDRFETEARKDNVGDAQRENLNSYAGAKDSMTGAFQGTLDQLFRSQEENLATLYRGTGDVLRTIASAPKAVQEWSAEMLAAFAVVKTSAFVSSVASFGAEVAKLAPGAEGAAASLGRVAGWLGVLGRFTPAASLITGYDLAKAALPLLSGLGHIARGDFWQPSDDQAYNDLKQQREELRHRLSAIDANVFRPGDADSMLVGLRHQLGAALINRPSIADTPEVARMRAEYDRLRSTDPNATDQTLQGMFAKFADLNAREKELTAAGVRLPGSMIQEFVAARHAIEDRQSSNIQQQASQLEAIQSKLLDALARQPASSAEAPEIASLRRQIGERETDLKAGYVAPFNPVRSQVADELAGVENQMASYVSKITGTIKQGAFLLDGIHDGRVGLGYDRLVPGGLTIGPGIDPRPGFGLTFGDARERMPAALRVDTIDLHYSNVPTTPLTIGGGSHFDVHGPITDPLRQSGAAPAQKVDVSGEAEVHTTTTLEIKPSAYFEGLLKTVSGSVHMRLMQGYEPNMVGTGGNDVKVTRQSVWHGPH